MKKFLVLFLSLLLLPAAWAEEAPNEYRFGDYTYILSEDGTATITAYFGNADVLVIPDTVNDFSVTSIEDDAFYLCESLTSVAIPDSVTHMTANPFAFCFALNEIRVSPDHPVFAAIDGVLFFKPDKTLVCYPAGLTAETYDIPNGILRIGDEAFCVCGSLSSITIPDSVTSIGDSAFRFCSMPSITIPESVTDIGDGAFYYCESLSSITIPNSVTSICDETFWECHYLTSVIIPDSVASIGDFAFADCFSLSSVAIPESVARIGDCAFSGCVSLTSVTLPASVPGLVLEDVFGDVSNITFTVPRGSESAKLCEDAGASYTYPDANDWLFN